MLRHFITTFNYILMNAIVKISFICIFLSIFNCKTVENKNDSFTTEQNTLSFEQKSSQMRAKGFVHGMIQVNKSEQCNYILTVETYEDALDPINIQDFFKRTIPEKVWVKYQNLRMQNRCKEARPVSITGMEPRTD